MPKKYNETFESSLIIVIIIRLKMHSMCGDLQSDTHVSCLLFQFYLNRHDDYGRFSFVFRIPLIKR